MVQMKKIKYSLVFNRRNKLNSNGEALIQIRAYQNSNRYFSTGIYIKKEYWDHRNKKVKPNHPNHFVYNRQITELLHKIEAFEIRMINRYGKFPIVRLHEFQEEEKENGVRSFTAFYEKELQASGYKPSSHKMYKLTLNKLKSFRSIIYFEEISYSLILEFDRFLNTQKIGVNSIRKHHHRLKRFINQAIKENYIKVDDNPYIKFKPKSAEPERPFLSEDDLQKLEILNFDSEEQEHLARIRDIYLFGAYTGLRFNDICRITPKHIEQTSKGLNLTIKAEKTAKNITLPLYNLFRSDGTQSKPEAILLKYAAPLLEYDDLKDIQFFNISNQYFNRSLKEIAQLAGIKKRITAHSARRTFATIMATKVKAPVLQRLLQHSRPDMTSIYIQLSNKRIEEELAQIQWKPETERKFQ